MDDSKLPDDGEYFLAKKKTSDALVFFCHFFQGHKKVLKRHIDFVNELGFDAYAFNLKDSPKQHYYLPYSQRSQKFGMKHALAEQIAEHLKLVTLNDLNRPLIVFAFSNVAGCAIEALVQFSDNSLNLKGLICDSGPGASFFYSSFKLIEQQLGISFLPLKLVGTPLVAFGWSPSLNKDIVNDLKLWNKRAPILSIRGWKDKLISPRHIDAIFEAPDSLNWKKLSLPEAGHLDGLKGYPDDYKPAVAEFIRSCL